MSTVETQNPPAAELTNAVRPLGLVQRLLLYSPIFIAAGVTIYVCVNSIATRMGTRYPLDWWESIYIMDGARVAKGLPVYEAAGEGHATHMYGPLGTYVIGAIYSVIGPSVRVGRWISLLSGLTATGLYTLLFVSRRNLFYLFVGAALFLSLHFRCMGLFTNTRPDITAFLLASAGLFLAYFAHERARFGWYGLSAALIVISFLFKQTYAVAALIPPLAILIIRPQPLARHLAFSLLPLATMAVAGIILKLFFPLVWFYAIDVPRLYRVFQDRVGLGIDSVFMHNPLFIVMIVVFLLAIGFSARRDRKITWLFVSMLIGGAMGVIAFAKRGGSYNSLLMIFGPMTAFCMLLLPDLMGVLSRPAVGPVVRVISSLALGYMILTTAFSVPLSKRLAFEHASNRRGYFRTIELVKKLDGTTLCPEEPTITFFAKGAFEPSLEAELEAAEPRRILQSWLANYLKSADWVVSVGTADMPGKIAPMLPELGFTQVSHPELGAEYTIWRRGERPLGTTRPAASD